MATKPSKEKSPERASIISAVKTYLGLVLVVLVVEAVLGALVLKTHGEIQMVALYGMLFVIVTLITSVSFFAYRKPEALLRTVGSQTAPEVQSLHDFCGRISGHWWERIKPDESSAISFVEISPDRATNTVKMKGKAYGKDGELSALWETIACCINASEGKIFYYWKGRFPSRPNEPFEGFGEISFHEFSGQIDSGDGIFSDTNLTDIKSTIKKSVEVRRSPEPDIRVMQEGDNKMISEMVRKKLS